MVELTEFALISESQQVMAEHLSVEEAADIKETFQTMDVNNNGKLTFAELKSGLQKIGQQTADADLQILFEAVSLCLYSIMILWCSFS